MLINSLVKLTERKNIVDFDFSKSLNHNLSNKILLHQQRDIEADVPIAAKENKWEVVQRNKKECLFKVYKFNVTKSLLYFLEEVIFYSDEINHHPNISIEDNKIVSIECFTKDMNIVTELDLKLSKQIDVIYEDIGFIRELS